MPIAQCNLGWIRYPLEDPRMRGFTEAVDRIHALADKSPGFIWRHQTPEGHALGVRIWDDPRILYNCTVWETREDLERFVYHTAHKRFLLQAREWFLPPPLPHTVIWEVPAGHHPSVEEACDRLRAQEQPILDSRMANG